MWWLKHFFCVMSSDTPKIYQKWKCLVYMYMYPIVLVAIVVHCSPLLGNRCQYKTQRVQYYCCIHVPSSHLRHCSVTYEPPIELPGQMISQLLAVIKLRLCVC